jgi:hypothetical protein
MLEYEGPMPQGGRLSAEDLRRLTGKAIMQNPPISLLPGELIGNPWEYQPKTKEEAEAMLKNAQDFLASIGEAASTEPAKEKQPEGYKKPVEPKMDRLLKAIALLPREGFSDANIPLVKALSEAIGEDVSAKERDMAFMAYQKQH